MRRYKPEKLKKGEGRDYEVRVNLGEDYMVPSRPSKWRLGFDERGAYWTRFEKQRNRADACRKISDWYSNSPLKKVLGKKSDEVLEVKDHSMKLYIIHQWFPLKLKINFYRKIIWLRL